jgi:hypothetical protein
MHLLRLGEPISVETDGSLCEYKAYNPDTGMHDFEAETFVFWVCTVERQFLAVPTASYSI